MTRNTARLNSNVHETYQKKTHQIDYSETAQNKYVTTNTSVVTGYKVQLTIERQNMTDSYSLDKNSKSQMIVRYFLQISEVQCQ